MSETKYYTLPSSEEIIRRLTTVSSEDHLIRDFYPAIAVNANQEVDAFGVGIMLVLGFDELMNRGHHISTLALVRAMGRKFIDALIVDDPNFAAEAKRVYLEMIN